jgi:hypothetical protein
MLRKTLLIFFGFLFIPILSVAADTAFVEFTSLHKDMDVSRVALNDAVWQTVSPYRHPLQRQFLVDPKPAEVGVREVLVQSIHDGKYVSFRLTWQDETKDETPQIMGFADGAAIQFPVRKEDFSKQFMGEKKYPVHILYWKAWLSKDKESGFQTTRTAYPNMTADIHTFDYPIKGEGTEKTQNEKDIFIPGRAARNPLSFPGKEVIAELSSTGPGTVTTKKTDNTTGDAEWKDGRWTVLFRRPLLVDDAGSVYFTIGEKMPVAFAVWEGSRHEAGSRKAVSPAWVEVEIEK